MQSDIAITSAQALKYPLKNQVLCVLIRLQAKPSPFTFEIEPEMVMKVKEIIKLIEADGCFFVRQKGSHKQFKHPIKKGTVTVAGKPSIDLLPKTMYSIFAQAGLKENKGH